MYYNINEDKEKEVRTMKKELMTNAWEIAKNAAKKFGGKAIEYIAGAMKMAWAAIKDSDTSLAKFQAVEAKMRKSGKWSMVEVLDAAKVVKFNEVMHKVGAYYGIEVVADGSNIGTYYISEKIWEVA
jgi:gp111